MKKDDEMVSRGYSMKRAFSTRIVVDLVVCGCLYSRIEWIILTSTLVSIHGLTLCLLNHELSPHMFLLVVY